MKGTINIFLGLSLLMIPLSLAYEEDLYGALPVKGGEGIPTKEVVEDIVTKNVTKTDVNVRGITGHGYRSIPNGIMQYHNCGNVISYQGFVYQFSNDMNGDYRFGNIFLSIDRSICVIKLEVK